MANATKNTSKESRSKQDNPAQSKRFIDAAREAEADETEEAADRSFKQVVLPTSRKNSEKNPTER